MNERAMRMRALTMKTMAVVCVIFAIFGGSWPAGCIAGDADDTARVIAGFSSGMDKFGRAEKGPWRSYAQEISTYWGAYERRIGLAMRKWACQELGRAEGVTVFYPFSGPDLPAAFQLFPDADHYILLAAENAGAPPALQNLSAEELADYLAVLRKAWKFYGLLGFFRTDDLDAVAHARSIRMGMTGPLMAFAVRLGFEIEAVEQVQLVRDGMDLALRTGKPGETAAWDSVRLSLRKDGRTVRVEYVRMNLSNAVLRRDPDIRNWVDRIAGNPTILKAASHLPQDPDFSILRDSMLRNAPIIVQDETGLDYGALAESFDVRLYGKFIKPNPSFDRNLQRSLAAAYQRKGAVKPLPFRLGYEKNAGSAVQIAVRKTNDAQLPRNCRVK